MDSTAIILLVLFLIAVINIWVIRRVLKINEMIDNQRTLITLLAGIALKMEVDEHFFPKVKQYEQPQVHPMREMFNK